MGSWKKAAGTSPEDRLDETAAFITAATNASSASSRALAAPYEKTPPARTRPAWPRIQTVAGRQR